MNTGVPSGSLKGVVGEKKLNVQAACVCACAAKVSANTTQHQASPLRTDDDKWDEMCRVNIATSFFRPDGERRQEAATGRTDCPATLNGVSTRTCTSAPAIAVTRR